MFDSEKINEILKDKELFEEFDSVKTELGKLYTKYGVAESFCKGQNEGFTEGFDCGYENGYNDAIDQTCELLKKMLSNYHINKESFIKEFYNKMLGE